ncbi:MAG: hypothetical protein QOH61_1332 [Chloroflexota bacterium]|jgi:hypothetical protein|nr:hypothetical protein [Chloroflexota bacterium]
MSARLQLKHGLVAEQDRLSTSADSLLVSEPSTGSKSRTKGNLYVLVSSASMGGRARDAAAVAAQTIQREYYYDESAGIPILLEKCFRSANRKLRGRDGGGLAQGAIGIAVAVIRGNELYVATVGAADAYLVRAARLLVPEHSTAPGIPAADLRVDVWRGELAVGDSLLLVSRRLTEAVGTEELKNAVVTLHPQSAVEHLHHLFVASGGEGSDAVLVVEATDLAGGRGDGRLPQQLMPSGDAYGELASGSAAAAAEAAAEGGPARRGGGRSALGAITGAIGGAVDRVLDLVPRRRTSVRRITPQVSRREAQRRGAMAILAFLAVILFVGVVIAFFPKGQENGGIPQVTSAEAAFNSAKDKTDQVLGAGGTTTLEPERAKKLLREAFADLKRAEELGVPAAPVQALRARITAGLDGLYLVHRAAARIVAALPAGADPLALEHGPIQDPDALYFIDGTANTVSRVDPRSTNPPIVVVKAGDGLGEHIGAPRFLAAGGLDLLIVDVRGKLWTWRPSNTKGGGSLRQIRIGGDQVWGNGVTDIATYPSNEEGYGLYVTLPGAEQILRYRQLSDGSALSSPTEWLTSSTEKVETFLDMVIDYNMYTITGDPATCAEVCRGDGVVQHNAGNLLSYSIAALPDAADLRPGHDFRVITGSGDRNTGRLYLYDATWKRIAVFGKTGGGYVEEWLSATGSPAMDDVRGILVVAPAADKPDDPSVLYWLTPKGLMASPLVNVAEPAAASPRPSISAGSSPSPTPRRRTPRP